MADQQKNDIEKEIGGILATASNGDQQILSFLDASIGRILRGHVERNEDWKRFLSIVDLRTIVDHFRVALAVGSDWTTEFDVQGVPMHLSSHDNALELFHEARGAWLSTTMFSNLIRSLNHEMFDFSNFPTGIKTIGSLHFERTSIKDFPKDLHVTGDFKLERSSVKALPENLTVDGDLVVLETVLTELPKGLKVVGSVYLSGSSITKLPEDVEVGSGIYLNGSAIAELPEGFSVNSDLGLANTGLTELPAGMSIGGSLNIEGTAISVLPNDLVVMGTLNITNSGVRDIPASIPDSCYIEYAGEVVRASIYRNKRSEAGYSLRI